MLDRRSLLKIGLLSATGIILQSNGALALLPKTPEKSIKLLNLHTGERLNITYFSEGKYINDSLDEINNLLRDHRTGDVAEMDPSLLDILYKTRKLLGSSEEFQVISGYRSPKTNAMLNKNTTGVAKKSLHLQGKAVDVVLPGRDLSLLRKTAMSLKSGGVGYYPDSGFVHLDTGRTRFW